MKAIVICKEVQSGPTKGQPDIGTGYTGFVQIGQLPGAYCAYVITGSAGQLTTIHAHANCVAGVAITHANDIRWPEMAQPIPAGMRTRINAWRTANSLAPIGAGVTLFQVVRFAANHFTGDGSTFDVFDVAP